MEKKDKMKRVTESEIRMLDILRAYGIAPDVIIENISYIAGKAREKREEGKVKKHGRI